MNLSSFNQYSTCLAGLHVFPTFVLNEFPLVLTLTLGVVLVKVDASFTLETFCFLA